METKKEKKLELIQGYRAIDKVEMGKIQGGDMDFSYEYYTTHTDGCSNHDERTIDMCFSW